MKRYFVSVAIAFSLIPFAHAARSDFADQPKANSCVEGHVDVFLEKLTDKVKRLLTDFGRFNRVKFELEEVSLKIEAYSAGDLGVKFESPVRGSDGENYELSFDHMPFQYFRPNQRGAGWDDRGLLVPPISCRMTIAHPSTLIVQRKGENKVVGRLSLPSSFNVVIY